MRVRTLEIRWHDSKPISTCDFQPLPFKKARPAQDKMFATHSYRLATGGEDNHVRLWMVYPNILPPSVIESASTSATETPAPRPPRIEYLATLSRHSAAVNVVRWSPNGELIASAGDDGMIIIWAPTTSPHGITYGSDLTPEDLQYEKEFWKPRTTFRCTTMQVYDLAWSPTGEYIIAGSTDNAARIFAAEDGKCLHEIAEHNHYVQGVAWDPLNEYIATQSSDRSMHIYSICADNGGFEVHAVGRNTRMPHHHSRTPSAHSHSRPRLSRRESTTSEADCAISETPERDLPPTPGSGMLTPSASIASTPSGLMFPPPPIDHPSSRRSSFSSTAPASPAAHSRYGRSPSPMPALPAIRMQPSAGAWASVKLYGDESFTNFFRRLTFSPDGGLLLTPAGQFEDPSVIPGLSRSSKGSDDQPTRGRKGHPSANEGSDKSSASSVYIYSRANFARPPIAQLPGHKKASVAVRFSPILYDLRAGVVGADSPARPATVVVEKGKEEQVSVDIAGPSQTPAADLASPSTSRPSLPSLTIPEVIAPAPRPAAATPAVLPSPALSASDSQRPTTPPDAKWRAPGHAPTLSNSTGSVFALPYRMLFAVATKDTVSIHDTQQAGPVCLLSKLHYDEFTDMSWSPDGQCLMLSSRDGYCTIVVFDEIMAAYHTQPSSLHSAPHHQASFATPSATPVSTPAVHSSALPANSSPAKPNERKRSEAPLTPATSVDDSVPSTNNAGVENQAEPPKKKRRVALTRVGDIG
ncbi:WD40 repeat-like protein [Gloeophyllum trabeum ATCC 11539]|uniref:WD40 repeat-like protein n=1 Tax=Gloeophyllum trabeum (strain ATCC 11539 / FP-39264 / Madison 617) TaxID=670483 RepID=S7PTN5_GLOTA|nr:WD40 repeat-like protein [Gloeophyllum trabeum ATCC 11539]EPQ50803.1 WD40 repeat-like protein [Gloeophyllum trabeum ATCC 11539]